VVDYTCGWLAMLFGHVTEFVPFCSLGGGLGSICPVLIELFDIGLLDLVLWLVQLFFGCFVCFSGVSRVLVLSNTKNTHKTLAKKQW